MAIQDFSARLPPIALRMTSDIAGLAAPSRSPTDKGLISAASNRRLQSVKQLFQILAFLALVILISPLV